MTKLSQPNIKEDRRSLNTVDMKNKVLKMLMGCESTFLDPDLD
jgi:hypothetical protein